jgi:Peptidase inhibitor family I36
MIKRLALFVSLFVAVVFTAATPAHAGRSACPYTYVCAWVNAGWTGTMAAYQPSEIYQATPSHCLNIDRTALQDKISSLASYNGAPNLRMRFYKDTNCYALGGYFDLVGTQQIKDLKGSGFNDTVSSVESVNCC